MSVRVSEAVNTIKAATEHGQLVIHSSHGVDGIGLDIQNWQRLYPALENLLDQSWFPDRDWVKELVNQNRDNMVLKLSQDRLNQLQDVVNQVQPNLPIVLEAWSSIAHPNSTRSFHVGLAPDDLPDLTALTEHLNDAFKLLAVDKSFSVTVSEGFILIVPEGPYSHFCATFALYLAKKSLDRLHGPTGREFREMVKYLPDYNDSNNREAEINEAISHWVTVELEEDWEWFERVRSDNFSEQPHARANIEKAVPILRNLLEDGRCHIEQPDEFFYGEDNESEGEENQPVLQKAYVQLKGVLAGVSRNLPSVESVSKIALHASNLADKM